MGENRFSLEGIDVRLRDAQGDVEAHLAYTGITPLPFSIGSPNIMGPYAYVPFMECYHGVGSLDHAVTGEVRIGDRRFDFDGGRGYLEKDWGRSMPLAWIWAQVNGFAGPGSCLLFSLARIPWLGRTFPGFFALLAEGGRLAPVRHLHRRARRASALLDGRDLHVEIRDRSRVLRLHAERSHEGTLLAPVDGAMERRIAESIDARIERTARGPRAAGCCSKASGGNAGLEIVGDPSLIGVRAAGAARRGLTPAGPVGIPEAEVPPMNDRIIDERYRLAREQYAELGVDTEAALAALARRAAFHSLLAG